MIKTVCEIASAILAVCVELGLCALVIYDVWKLKIRKKQEIQIMSRLEELQEENNEE